MAIMSKTLIRLLVGNTNRGIMKEVIETLVNCGFDVIVFDEYEKTFFECQNCKKIYRIEYAHDADEFGLEGLYCDDCIWEVENGE